MHCTNTTTASSEHWNKLFRLWRLTFPSSHYSCCFHPLLSILLDVCMLSGVKNTNWWFLHSTVSMSLYVFADPSGSDRGHRRVCLQNLTLPRHPVFWEPRGLVSQQIDWCQTCWTSDWMSTLSTTAVCLWIVHQLFCFLSGNTDTARTLCSLIFMVKARCVCACVRVWSVFFYLQT